MSGAVVVPMLSDQEKVDARRFMGYPAYGSGPNDDSFGRYFGSYPTMEFRIANLLPAELVTMRARLAALTAEETLFEASGALVYVGTAAVFTRNPNTISEHQRFLDAMRRRLCEFLGLPPGPQLSASSSSIRLIV